MPKRSDWSEVLARWGSAPSATEQAKCDNAVSVVKRALAAYGPLQGRTLDIYAKGSYANRTNVRSDSDVDVSVCYRDAWYSRYADSVREVDLGYGNHSYTYSSLRADVVAALVSYFGDGAAADTIAINVHANTYRVDADVVPCFEHRWHYRNSGGAVAFHRGEWIDPVGRATIVNWPEQNYANGVAKNDRTQRRFKAVARILKSLRNEMVAEGFDVAKPIASFLSECLIYNVPDTRFGNDALTDDVTSALAFLYSGTKEFADYSEWREVNGLKMLFGPHQPWTPQQVNAFVLAAWSQMELS